MKKLITLLITFVVCLSFQSPSEAKWWIFGQGTDEIITNYIYINNNSLDETSEKVVLFKDSLKDNTIRISGKASVRNANIGAAFITLDNKASWKKANLSKNGYFEYTFTPEMEKEYGFYIKLVDTLGKTNDIDSTHKIIKVVDENINKLVVDALAKLVDAYQLEDSKNFMKNVSNDFTGDSVNLDFALRKDFNAFDHIQLQLFPNNISRDSSGKVFVAVQYIRQVIATKTGRAYRDNGFTEFVFKNDSGNLKLFSMKNPLMFGLSDAANVATGTIQNTNNSPILMVDSTSNVKEESFKDAIREIEEGTSSTASGPSRSGTVTLPDNTTTYVEGYGFTRDMLAGSEVSVASGTNIKETTDNINNVTTANVSTSDFDIMDWMAGRTYHLRFTDGKYMVVYFYPYYGTIRMQYKYQPDGTPNF